jgi:hypothetical protein
MSVAKSSSSGKKTYHRPTCSAKSIYEVGTLLGKKTSNEQGGLGVASALSPSETPVLVVEGYEGKLGLVEETTDTLARQLEKLSVLTGGGMVEMQFADEQDSASPESFLLLDLRYRRRGERSLLESIGGIPDLGNAVVLVILVSSMEQFDDWRGLNATHCWQLKGSPSRVELLTALRSFLRFCRLFANWQANQKPAPAKLDKYALIGGNTEE